MNTDFDPNQNNNQEDNPYNIFDGRGRQKNIKWSVASVLCAALSLGLAFFGWAGLVFGILAVVFSIVARRSLGYFNGWAVAGLILGIMGTVFSVALIVIAYTSPELLETIFGFSGVPGTPEIDDIRDTTSTG